MLEHLKSADAQPSVQITVDGQVVSVPAGIPLAAALLLQDAYPARTSPVHERSGQKLRAPYCMMGVCFECLVEIDGVPNQQGCLVLVQEGMDIRRQTGAADLDRAVDGKGAGDV